MSFKVYRYFINIHISGNDFISQDMFPHFDFLTCLQITFLSYIDIINVGYSILKFEKA